MMNFPPPVQPVDPASGPDDQSHGGRDQITEFDRTFPATKLALSNLPGNVHVRVGAQRWPRLSMKGPKHLLDQIDRSVAGDTLTVSGPPDLTATTIVASSIVIDGDGVHVSGLKQPVRPAPPPQLDIVIDVPARTPTDITDRGSGRYRVGDIDADLTLALGGDAHATCGRVRGCAVSLGGASHAEVASVAGSTLQVSGRGSSQITVRDGTVEFAGLTVRGASNALYGGRCATAELSARGSSNIRVNHVTERLSEERRGVASISVHVRPPADPSDF